ncbi:DUF948 domain-containing protein [Geomicrobium sp. JSM 1781026]|uniref:DUF948 domain-containing protein n=1 Tax=unclassified Geomicrobium TaxID=2628951 RepID=UPI00045F1F72|nr:DUF948 domain-containing protein [Geomicrobium sp. JCM 19039]GAK12972.1 general stress protein [Geomicrobium sp. JCM 19039]
MTAVYISVVIVAVAIVVLIFYLIQTLKSVQGVVEQLGKTTSAAEQQLQGITTEVDHLMKTSNRLAEDLEGKAESLDGLFHTADEVGKISERLNESLQTITKKASHEAEKSAPQVTQFMQWGNAAMDLYSKWQNRKHSGNT